MKRKFLERLEDGVGINELGIEILIVDWMIPNIENFEKKNTIDFVQIMNGLALNKYKLIRFMKKLQCLIQNH